MRAYSEKRCKVKFRRVPRWWKWFFVAPNGKVLAVSVRRYPTLRQCERSWATVEGSTPTLDYPKGFGNKSD